MAAGCKLPVELITKILKVGSAEAEASYNDIEAAMVVNGTEQSLQVIRDRNLFLSRAGLVCKQWHSLVEDQERIIHIESAQQAVLLWQSIGTAAVYRCKRMQIGVRLLRKMLVPGPFIFESESLLRIVRHLISNGQLQALSIPCRFVQSSVYDEKESHDWHQVCSLVVSLHLYTASSGEAKYLDLEKAQYLHQGSSSVRTLVLSGIGMSPMAGSTSPRLACQNLVWRMELARLEEIDYAKLLPSLSSLTFFATEMFGFCYSPPRPMPNASILAAIRSIFLIPSLASLRIISADRTGIDGYGCRHCYTRLISPVLYLVDVPKLEIDFQGCGTCWIHFLRMCRSFEDPAFCPRLRYLPIFRPPVRRHPIQASPAEMESLQLGLRGLRSRGISIDQQEMKGTIWEYAA